MVDEPNQIHLYYLTLTQELQAKILSINVFLCTYPSLYVIQYVFVHKIYRGQI